MAYISKIKAGDFNERVILKSKNFSQDSFGGSTESLTTVATVWAKKDTKSLRDVEEKTEGKELESYARFVYTIRYSLDVAAIKTNWVLQDVITLDQYEILGFVTDPRREYIEIFVKDYLPTQEPS